MSLSNLEEITWFPDWQDKFTMRWYGTDDTYIIYDKVRDIWFWNGEEVGEGYIPDGILEGKDITIDYEEYDPTPGGAHFTAKF